MICFESGLSLLTEIVPRTQELGEVPVDRVLAVRDKVRVRL